MTKLLRGKKKTFVWIAAANSSFQELKAAFLKAGVLKHWNPELAGLLETDASGGAISGCLSQRDPKTGKLHPVAFYSRKLTPAEENYDIYDRELLAIVDSLRHWRVYLEGAYEDTKVYSDHQNLERFTTTKILNRRQARWAEILGSYNFVVIHRPGKENTKADLLSRRPDYMADLKSNERQPHPPILRPDQLTIQATSLEETILERDEAFVEQLKATYETDPYCKKALETARADTQQKANKEWTISGEGLLL